MIRDLLAIVDNADRAAPMLDRFAESARLLKAEASVTLLTAAPVLAPDLAPLGSVYVPEDVLDSEARAGIDAIRAQFDRHQVPVRVRGLCNDVTWLAGDLRHSGQLADLIVVGASADWRIEWLRRRVAESVLMGSGTPLLLLPDGGALPPVRHAVLAWKPSTEAARALHALVAIAEPGAIVDVVTIGDPHEPCEEETASAREVARHLKLHRFDPRMHYFECRDRVEADLIQKFAVETGADLIAAGGFGHSRIREIILGGVTRDLIAAPRLPVLLAH